MVLAALPNPSWSPGTLVTMETWEEAVERLAPWSDLVPLAEAKQMAPRSPGVYLIYVGDPRSLVYVGMAGPRNGAGLRGRLRVYTTGKGGISGFGEAALDRAFADPAWVADRQAEAEHGEPRRAKEIAALAVTRLDAEVRWATTSTAEEARALEYEVAGLVNGRWGRRR